MIKSVHVKYCTFCHKYTNGGMVMKRIFKRSLAAILAASMFMSSSGMVSLGASISDASQTESVGGNYTQVDNVSTLSVEASTADETSGNSWGGGK